MYGRCLNAQMPQGLNAEMSVFKLIETVRDQAAKQKHSVKSNIVLCAKMVNSFSFLTTGIIFHTVIPEAFLLS